MKQPAEKGCLNEGVCDWNKFCWNDRAAYKLTKTGAQVDIFEASDTVGNYLERLRSRDKEWILSITIFSLATSGVINFSWKLFNKNAK